MDEKKDRMLESVKKKKEAHCVIDDMQNSTPEEFAMKQAHETTLKSEKVDKEKVVSVTNQQETKM